jgi:hypothetical protein
MKNFCIQSLFYEEKTHVDDVDEVLPQNIFCTLAEFTELGDLAKVHTTTKRLRSPTTLVTRCNDLAPEKWTRYQDENPACGVWGLW